MKNDQHNLITLNTVFVVALIISNVIVAKVIVTGLSIFGVPLTFSGATVTYAITYLCTDIISEIWGKKEAQNAVKRGFICQLIVLGVIVLVQWLPTADAETQQAYEKILGQMPVFVIGSLLAFVCSQSWDIWMFHKIRNKFNANPTMRWVWNNGSTMTSQLIDEVIWCLVCYGLGLGYLWTPEGRIMLVGLTIGDYLFKFCLALLDTPFFYLLTNKKAR